jgi:hypothetical protein
MPPKKGFDEIAEKQRLAAAEQAEKARQIEAERKKAEAAEQERLARIAAEARALEIYNGHFERFRRGGVTIHFMANGVTDETAIELARAITEKVSQSSVFKWTVFPTIPISLPSA